MRPYIPMAKARGFTGAVDKIIEALEKAAWYLNREINSLKTEGGKTIEV